jgi:cell surface protein SprA
VGTSLLFAWWLSAARPTHAKSNLLPLGLHLTDSIPSDTTKKDASGWDHKSYEKSRKPTYQPKDRFSDPFTNRTSPSPLILKEDTNLDIDVKVDTTGIDYTIHEKMGDMDYRPVSNMTFEEFSKLQEKQMIRNYWKAKSAGLDGESAVSGRNLIPPIYVSPVMDRIFGGSHIDIRPNGFVTLDFGGRWERVDNPAIPIRRQRNGGFAFDMQMNANIVGKVGEKLSVLVNYDNNTTFDFENDFKVEFTGFEEDIIKKIEIGNVSMPVNNSLMAGAQNLFGVKTQLQFGKLFITGVASTQRGKSESISIEGGAQGREFELQASDYDENRNFFLAHFFRDNYERWINSPQIISGINITRVEVYVMNRNNNTQTLRNVVGFMDLGESTKSYREKYRGSSKPAANGSNDLMKDLRAVSQLRNVERIDGILESSQFSMEKSKDFERINGARKLEDKEFSVHRQLGYITLSRKLQNDEILAVSYEYTFNGQVYKVGELAEDYSRRRDSEAIFLKLLRPAKIDTRTPMWDLMMKNIYALNASQVSREGFQLRVIYRDDRTGQDNPNLNEGARTQNQPLVQLLGLDRLNQNNDFQPDGNFDFVEGLTINPEYGTIIFPVLEPFGRTLRSHFDESTERRLIQKYVYDTLYRTTKADAELVTSLNKFFIRGRYMAGSASEIVLPGINISPNSVKVMAGNTPLKEGLDYTVDYNMGRVQIINEGVLQSGKNINISYEKADMFNFQTRSLVGARADYIVNDDLTLGATVLYLNERPLITRVRIGEEPTRNTKWGLDINYRKDSRFLTKMVDAIPFIQTKELSTITFNGEFAQLLPGTSNIVDGDGTSYIDDFEAAIMPINLGTSFLGWKLASTPKTSDHRFDPTEGRVFEGNFAHTYKRAKLAWYNIDNIFYRRGGPGYPSNIDAKDTENHYVRGIIPQEIYRERDREVINTNLNTLDLAYFPSERGMYNYNPNLNPDGTLPNPEQNWGGITRAITSEVDFDKNNIEYIEFWLMDPFIEGENGRVLDGKFNKNNTTGGELIFNLGSISEDVMRDGLHNFENGLPPDGSDRDVRRRTWGKATTKQFLTEAFDNNPNARQHQDVGLDGLKSGQEEREYFKDFVTAVESRVSDPAARQQILSDVSGDKFQYYLGQEHDDNNRKIIERYKNFNGMDGNSPIMGSSNLPYNPVGSNLPDNEDLNNDNTISDLEEYYEYRLKLKPGMGIGDSYIVDEIISTDNPSREPVKFYLFRIPVRKPDRVEGDINGFKSIRFIRTYLTNFSEPVVLRFEKLQLVGSTWRIYQENLFERGLNEIPEPYDPNFTVGAVNIEENSAPGPGKIPYVLPPGFIRDRDNTSMVPRRINEQSLRLCVDDLKHRDARAVFKNVSLDLVNYGRLQMFFHAQSDEPLQDGDVTAFFRLGTDFDQNYYEIEVPLKITPPGSRGEREIWPKENELDIALNELYALKARRNRELGSDAMGYPFSAQVRQYKITVVGRPELSTVQTMMIGIRNPSGGSNSGPKSVCIWANELRVSDFDRQAGWAANSRVNAKLADFADVTLSGRYITYGFGDIQNRISERSREETTEFDVSANINMDKFLPERSGIKIPMFLGYQTTTIRPFFDPLDPDVPLEASLMSRDSPQEAARYRDLVSDRAVRRSINFTNVRKTKTKQDAKHRIYDIENLSLTLAYSDQFRSNISTETYLLTNHRAGLGYNFSPREINVEPFSKVKFLNSPYLKGIKEFNFSPMPNSLSFRGDLDRRFVKTQFRNADLTTTGILPQYEKLFTFNRIYNMRWNLTRNLALDYNARTNAIIDEPDGDITTQQEREEVWNNIKRMGRLREFDQTVNATYRLPFDKSPLTDWINADAMYGIGYTWTAGAREQQDTLGNIIQNNRERAINGKFDLVKLYNKVKLFKEINNPTPKKTGPQKLQKKKKEEEEDEEEDKVKKLAENKAVSGVLRTVMSVRSINFNYSIREGTLLPGFRNNLFLLGMDKDFVAPGVPFILGSQDAGVRHTAARNGWLAESPFLTTPFSQSYTENIDLRANIEPFKDMKVTLDAKKMKMGNYQEIFRMDSSRTEHRSYTPAQSGSYSISFFTLGTAFGGHREENASVYFQNFERNRNIIQRRLSNANPHGEGYSENSQDVLIPAFLAAYSGRDVNGVNLSPFPRIPIPNWRMDYAGLGRIPALSEIFTSINLTHAYSSVYSVSNFSNSLLYDNVDFTRNIENYPFATLANDDGLFIPLYVIGQVTIAERFAPLLGVNLRTKSKVTARVEYKTERNLALNLSNAQVTEINNKDFVIDIGYTKAGFKLPFKVEGRTVVLKNDLTLKLGFTVRDNRTIQRKLSGTPVASGNGADGGFNNDGIGGGGMGDDFDDFDNDGGDGGFGDPGGSQDWDDDTNWNGDNILTAGNLSYQFRPTINYVVNDKLNLMFYFERNINEPRISNSFKRASTAFGIQVRFSIAQ